MSSGAVLVLDLGQLCIDPNYKDRESEPPISNDVFEMALAHAIRDRTEVGHWRDKLLENGDSGSPKRSRYLYQKI